METRHKLLNEALLFVRAARHAPGVIQISMIGSLITDKADPKDIALLVTVTDEADLTRLATLGRKLQGHCQNLGLGGEVFLADERSNYLGRICPWKVCAPGIRLSCDALHCGRRPYLHDDWQDIKLALAQVAKPPLELWPKIYAREPIPNDVAEILIQPFQQERSLT